MKKLFFTTITKPPEVIVVKFFFLCMCLFLSSCFNAVKGKQLESTYNLHRYYLNDLKFNEITEAYYTIPSICIVKVLTVAALSA